MLAHKYSKFNHDADADGHNLWLALILDSMFHDQTKPPSLPPAMNVTFSDFRARRGDFRHSIRICFAL